jgi:hypothetical protein
VLLLRGYASKQFRAYLQVTEFRGFVFKKQVGTLFVFRSADWFGLPACSCAR